MNRNFGIGMKKYIFIILSVLLLGCDKMEDNVFSENPDDRLQKTEEEYRQTILAARMVGF